MMDKKPLYLWRLDKDTYELKCIELIERINRSHHSYVYWRTPDGKYGSTQLDKFDKLSGRSVVSYSNDYNYIWEIVSKALYQDYLKKSDASSKALNKFTLFREVNKRG